MRKKKRAPGMVETKVVLEANDVQDWLYAKVVVEFERWLLAKYESQTLSETRLVLLEANIKLRELIERGPLATHEKQFGSCL